MRVTLISPRLALQKSDFLGSGIPYWPVELAVFAAFLKQQGEEVRVVDLFGEGVRRLEDAGDHYLQGVPIRARTEDSRIREAECLILYAISSMSHGELIEIVKLLRSRRPEVPIGILENSQAVTAYALSAKSDDFFSAGADILICGEPYWNWEEIRRYILDRHSGNLPQNLLVPAMPKSSQMKRIIRKDCSYPVPAWEMFNCKGYWSLPYSHGPKTKKYFPILTSRGCPYPCDFCVVPETNETAWRPRAAAEVVNEIMELRNRFGVYDFHIEDLNPTINPRRTQEICDLLIEKKAGVRFYVVSGTKAETVKLDQVEKLASAGCRYLSISPESGSSQVMKAIGKPFDYAHGLELVRKSHEYGIYTQACFVAGHPAESEEAHELSKSYLRKLVRAGLDEVVISVVAPLPGSGLFQQSAVPMGNEKLLLSFSPKGRKDWEIAARRRSELVRIFFWERFKKNPFSLLWQGIRAVSRHPRTKMENLPARIAFTYWQVLKCRLRGFATIRPG